MTSLPIPLVVAFLLLVLAAANHQRLAVTATGRVFELVLYLFAASLVCIGLRWAFDLIALLPIAAGLSVIGMALTYLAFRSLGRKGPVLSLARDAWHLLPILLILMAIAIRPPWVEVIVIVTNLVYALLLIRLAHQGPGSLQMVRLSVFSSAQRALWLVAALLIVNVVMDVIITIDFLLYDGRHAERFVGVVNLFVLLLLGWGLVRAAGGRTIDDESMPAVLTENGVASDADYVVDRDSDRDRDRDRDRDVDVDVETASVAEDHAVELEQLAHLNRLLIDDGLYADTELNLMRLARKSGIPARTVSRIINTHTGQNMSQWVNSARIEKACERLKDGSTTVTQAMHDAGFLTKSNFNREFRRITGCSPSEWRARHC